MDESKPSGQPGSSEYGDAVADVLKDQVRRDELRSAAAPGPARPRLHPAAPPVLALISIWLWAFPPEALQPKPPVIPPVQQEAGLRMEMFIRFNNIQRYVTENGRLPSNLEEMRDATDGVVFMPLEGNVFKLIGTVGDITVDFTSTEPPEDLIADAKQIVSGELFSSEGAPAT